MTGARLPGLLPGGGFQAEARVKWSRSGGEKAEFRKPRTELAGQNTKRELLRAHAPAICRRVSRVFD